MVAKTITIRKKYPEIVEEELLNSFRESDAVEEKDQRESIETIRSYKEII